MCPRVPGEQAVERAGRRAEERGRDPDRRRDPDAVAIARDVLDGDPALVTGDPRPDRAPRRLELLEPRPRDRGTALGPGGDLLGGQVAEAAQQIVDAVERGRAPIVGQRLETQLQVGQGIGIEELAQLLLAEQLAQQVAIERQRAGTALASGLSPSYM